MTKEELEIEIDKLVKNISGLICLGHEVSEPLKKLTECRSELLSLTHTERNTNQAV
jgi:hypothetical protein